MNHPLVQLLYTTDNYYKINSNLYALLFIEPYMKHIPKNTLSD